jgi:hypothetical protein
MDGSLRGLVEVRAPVALESGSDAGARSFREVFARLVREPFVLLVLATEALVLAIRLPDLVAPDTWLALVAGRKIATGGLPHHDTLTIWPHGASWVDQQWLGQLLMYGTHSVGGLRLVLFLNAVVLVAAFALALGVARSSGGSSRSVALVGAVALFVAFPNSVARTQVFAFVFFVAVFALLAWDSRAASRRVFLVLPLLVLWANVHGSAVLGAGLVVLWALASVVRAVRRPGAGKVVLRAAGLALAAPICLLASPYAFDLPGYYRTVLASPAFRSFVTEWAPTSFPDQWPFFVLAVAALWLTARKPARLSLFEHGALLFTLVAGLAAVRNIAWFALVTVMVVPRALDDLWPAGQAPVRHRVNRAISVAALVALVVAFGAIAIRQLELAAHGYPSRALASVTSATRTDPSPRVFANEWYSDWLIWNAPRLAGRLAFDARFELLSTHQIREVADFRARTSPEWLSAADGYRILVLDPRVEKRAIRAVLREPGTRQLYRDRRIAVLLRSRPS